MNSAQGGTARLRGGNSRRGSNIATAMVGLSLVGSALASTVVLPDAAPLAPGGSIPLLTTRASLAPAITQVASRTADRVSWQLPLAFEPADEHAPADAGFMARGPGYSVFVGPGGALLALQRTHGGDVAAASGTSSRRHPHLGTAGEAHAPKELRFVAMRLDGARTDVTPRVEKELPGRIHRISGSNPQHWQTRLRAHGRVVYPEVFPGVDVAYYGRGRELEYDFIVGPGANPDQARLRFDGVQAVRIDEAGDLRLETGAGTLIQRRPEAYQQGPEGREPVKAAYGVNPDGSVGFRLGDYDRERTLVIDPVLSYATFVGGSGLDQCWDIAVDNAGYAFVAGETESVRLTGLRIVSTNAFQKTYQGGQASVAGDAFVAKLNPDGTSFEWFTYLGGSDLDGALAIALGTGGEPVIAGFTTSTNFPLTAGAYQTVVGGDTNRYTGRKLFDAFVTRLRADGSGLVASTLFGGEGEDQALDLVLAADQTAIIVGSSSSTNLPMVGATDGGAYSGTRDGFLAVLKADGTALLRSRFFGGSGRDSAEGVALNPAGDIAHVVGLTESTNFPVVAALQSTNSGGFDVFAAGVRLSDGSTEYATYLGGEADEYGYRVNVGLGGQVWVAGVTFSTNLPLVAPMQSTNAGFSDALLARLAPDGKSLEMCSFFGGNLEDSFWDVRVDTAGRVHLAGETLSRSLPGLDTNSVFGTNKGLSEILIVRLEADGTPMTSLYGAPGDELAYAVATDPAGSAYVAGRVRSVSFPVSSTNVAQAVYGGDRTDGFVLKLTYEPTLTAELAGDGIRLSWPAPNAGFALESAPVADAAGTWVRESAPVLTLGTRHSVQLPMTATNCVFRLRWIR